MYGLPYSEAMRQHMCSVGLSFKSAQSELPSYFIHRMLYYWKSLVVVIEEVVSRCVPTAGWTQHPTIFREQILWEFWVITLPLCCLPHKQDVGSKECGTLQCWARKQAHYSKCKHWSAPGYLGNEEAGSLLLRLCLCWAKDQVHFRFCFLNSFGPNYWGVTVTNLF